MRNPGWEIKYGFEVCYNDGLFVLLAFCSIGEEARSGCRGRCRGCWEGEGIELVLRGFCLSGLVGVPFCRM